ncbi:FKBP-type peptidyl-prolyl cis-trans isomerase [Saccharicrinis sp. FJH54]|uniref:FKBP-type peptidyl-prolyl cis-trans isomerase n=1 Tax=Saccharicrinis sp. FJH54 TaxID=3344665 RepID=UPI0035D42F52
MKLLLKLSFLLLVVTLISCGTDYSAEKADSEMQFDEYIKAAGIPESDKLESGLYLIPREEGDGKMPESGDKVIIEYRVYTLDSMYIQDNELSANKFEFTLYGSNELASSNYSIPYGMVGLHEGLTHMKEGGKATMIIPFNLAFNQYVVDNLPRYMNFRVEVQLINISEVIFE